MRSGQAWGRFLILTGALIVIVRTFMLAVYPLLLHSASGYALISDRIHHYHVGLALFLAGAVFYRRFKAHLPMLLALALALLVEEYLVIIYELGVEVPYVYLSPIDNGVVYLVAVGGVLLGLAFPRPPNDQTTARPDDQTTERPLTPPTNRDR